MDQNQRFEYLFQKGLDMESQMEKIIEDAQPKQKPEMKIKYAKPIIITRDLLTGTPEYQAQKQLSDLELEQQIQNTIKQAIRAADNKPPEKYTNAVTEEMIGTARNANDADSLVIATYDAESRAASAAYLKSKNKG